MPPGRSSLAISRTIFSIFSQPSTAQCMASRVPWHENNTSGRVQKAFGQSQCKHFKTLVGPKNMHLINDELESMTWQLGNVTRVSLH
jgi:hypothetical protein